MSKESLQPFPFKVSILYEDADSAVVDKPAGLMVHPDGRAEGPFLTDWITMKFPGAVLADEPLKVPDGSTTSRPGIIHRLDRDTSGSLIIAKTAAGYATLKEQFRAKTVAKKYLAFVWGELKEEFGTITRPIGRSGSDFRRWSAQPGARGEIREAETYWTRLWTGEVTIDAGSKEKFSLLEAEPKTGRTHQIRVHFLAVHHPIVCDSLYAPKRPPALGFRRLALHSQSIAFTTIEGKRLEVEAPLPEDFSEAINNLGIHFGSK